MDIIEKYNSINKYNQGLNNYENFANCNLINLNKLLEFLNNKANIYSKNYEDNKKNVVGLISLFTTIILFYSKNQYKILLILK